MRSSQAPEKWQLPLRPQVHYDTETRIEGRAGWIMEPVEEKEGNLFMDFTLRIISEETIAE